MSKIFRLFVSLLVFFIVNSSFALELGWIFDLFIGSISIPLSFSSCCIFITFDTLILSSSIGRLVKALSFLPNHITIPHATILLPLHLLLTRPYIGTIVPATTHLSQPLVLLFALLRALLVSFLALVALFPAALVRGLSVLLFVTSWLGCHPIGAFAILSFVLVVCVIELILAVVDEALLVLVKMMALGQLVALLADSAITVVVVLLVSIIQILIILLSRLLLRYVQLELLLLQLSHIFVKSFSCLLALSTLFFSLGDRSLLISHSLLGRLLF